MEESKAILFVEDCDEDFFLFNIAVERAGIRTRVIRAHDGREAIDYLEGRGEYSVREQYPRPCLIITDLKMPRVDGFELLAWLNQREELKDIPAVVLSSSGQESDRRRAAELGARAYFVKPCSIGVLQQWARELAQTWIAAHCGSSV